MIIILHATLQFPFMSCMLTSIYCCTINYILKEGLGSFWHNAITRKEVLIIGIAPTFMASRLIADSVLVHTLYA